MWERVLAIAVLGAAAAQGGAASSLEYQVPEGWSRSEDPSNGVVSLSPPGVPPGGVCLLLAFPPDDFAGTADALHEEVVRQAATSGKQLLSSKRAADVGLFEVSVLQEKMANGATFTMRIYSARWAGRGQAFALTASSGELSRRFTPVVEAMLSRITAPSASADTGKRSGSPSSPPAPGGKGGLSGLYVAFKASGGFNYGVSKDYMVFFPDGTAFWHLPDEGLLGFDAARSRKESPDFWGRYEMKGDSIAIHWAAGPEYSGERRADGKLLLNTYTYLPLSSGPEGQTLDGTYRPDNTKDSDCCDVTFHPDGTFQDRGVRTVAGKIDLSSSGNGNAVPTGPGRGHYQIAQDSIVFQYDDGRREQLSFYIPDADGGRKPPVIAIHTFSISRRR